MHLSKNDIPVKINTPGAIARQIPDFGIASGAIGAEYFTMSAERTWRRSSRDSKATPANPPTGVI